MDKNWINRAVTILEHSLNPVPMELNELDWKESLSPNHEKLTRHLSAFSNLPGGGFMVFGVKDSTGKLNEVTQNEVSEIVKKLSNLGKDLFSPLRIEHAIVTFQNVPLLFVYITESAIKPVYIKNNELEDTYIRSGGTTRKASTARSRESDAE